MTSALLCFWLAAAQTEGEPGDIPQLPAVAPPKAPAPSAPPVPSPPELPGPARAPAFVGKAPSKRASPPEATSTRGEQTAIAKTPPSSGKNAEPAGPAPLPGPTGSKGKKPQPPAPVGRGIPAPLPTLTTAALKGEMRQSAGASGEGGAPLSDRGRLEQLAAEIAKAREALKQETARLEALIKQRSPCEEAPAPSGENGPAGAAGATAKDTAREQLESVSKTMKGMKPEQAAAVVSQLDHHLAAEVLRRMRPADAGLVMGYLKPELAAELATEIALHKPPVAKKGAAP